MKKLWWLLPVALIAAVVWVSDTLTMQGERTVYTAACRGGAWQGNRCTGELVAGDRYRYRALRARSEVVFWLVGSSEPSGKFTGCDVTDGRNWSCRSRAATPDAARTVTLEMAHGQALADKSGVTRPLHRVSKLAWTLMMFGWWFGNSVDED